MHLKGQLLFRAYLDTIICYDQVWHSKPGLLEVVAFTDETDELVNSVRLIGRPQRTLLGYALLSK